MHPMARRMPVAAGGGWAAPDPVTDLTAQTGGSGVDLAWSLVPGASGYNIQRSLTNSDFANIATGEQGPTYTNSSGDPDALYYYRVIAMMGMVPSAPSNVASANYPPPP